MSQRRLWTCLACKRQFSVLTGTVLAGTRLDPAVWIAAVDLMAQLQRAPSAPEVARRTGTTREAAGRVARLLAAAGEIPALQCLLEGTGHPAGPLTGPAG